MNHRLVATAGHVDHGKTSLLRALTGTDADRLEEEQKRGLTIDLGFADMVRDGLHLGFVDVPGHHDFIKNMVSGVGSVQGVLFVVSAVDGWQEQSREHFEIINLLEPPAVMFAVTKIDRADDDLVLLVEEEIREAVEDTHYADAPVVPVSSETGEGVEAVEDELFDIMTSVSAPVDHGKPYCPIDRVFSVEGQGTVVTGSLSGGDLSTEETVVRQPDGANGRVRGLQQYHESVEQASRSARVAVNVPDWEADDVRRGDILTVTKSGRTARTVDGWFRSSRHLPGGLAHDTQVLSYLGTDRFESRILTPDQQSFRAGDAGLMRIQRSSDDGFYRPGDRLLVRDFSDRNLLGCLTVLSVSPDRSLADQSYHDWLRRRLPVTAEAILETELDGQLVIPFDHLAEGQRFSVEEFREVARSNDSVTVLDDTCVLTNRWQETVSKVETRVNEYHENHPYRNGFPITELPEAVEEVREFFLDELETRGYVADDTILRRRDFEPRLTGEDEDRLEGLLAELEDAGLEGPDREDLESNYGTHVLEYAVNDGAVVELSEQRLVERSRYRRLKRNVVDYMNEEEPCRLSELRDCLDSSRKYVIPFMEYLDQQEVTVRDGDVRYLQSS